MQSMAQQYHVSGIDPSDSGGNKHSTSKIESHKNNHGDSNYNGDVDKDNTGDPFNDFDGVHFTKTARQNLNAADLDSRGIDGGPVNHHFAQPEGKELVYYPAPVPVMLNLPPKLSTARAQTQTKISQTVPEDLQYSKRDNPTSFRNSLALKSHRSKADVSSLFENILDATVASPVLSVVNHSVSNTRPSGPNPSHARHILSDSKLSVPGMDDHISNPEELERKVDSILLARKSMLSLAQGDTDVQASMTENRNLDGDAQIIAEEMSPENEQRASQYPHSAHSDSSDIDTPPFVPATLLAELESRKTQQRARTNKTKLLGDTQQMPTLLERDAIAEVKQQARKRGPINLAWQSDQPAVDEAEDDVPLGVLFANKLSSRPDEAMRMPGLLAMREAEDNEPLRKRQERLKTFAPEPPDDLADEKETLGQRRNRLQAAQRSRVASDENKFEREESDHQIPSNANSMSALLQSNPQKQSYMRQQDHTSRGLLSSELPFGYQAQQKMHLNFIGYTAPTGTTTQQPHNPPVLQYDNNMYQSRNSEMGIPFPYAPVNAAYLQQQQAILADQIEKWRTSVW